MTIKRSLYASELERFGFDEWSDVESGELVLDAIEQELSLSFFSVDILSKRITFAFDEFETLWVAEGTIDLSPLGFNEIPFESTRKASTLN